MEVIQESGAPARVEVLLPAKWLEKKGISVGAELPFALENVPLAGLGTILEVRPCPPIGPQRSGQRVVTGTFTRYALDLFELRVEGSEEALRATSEHPVYSVDRESWIPLASLAIGESVRLNDERTARVESLEWVGGGEAVYDLEVHRSHTFYVGADAVLVHNGKKCKRAADLPARGKPNSTDVVDRGNGKGTIRDYGPDGKAKTDYDFGHDHGAGDPHAHDWDWNKPGAERQPGRPLSPDE
jgi:hypothetical protein